MADFEIEQHPDASGGYYGSIDPSEYIFYKEQKSAEISEKIKNIKTNEELAKLFGLKSISNIHYDETHIDGWWFSTGSDGNFFHFTKNPTFEKDFASIIKFKNKNGTAAYLDTNTTIFPYHSRTETSANQIKGEKLVSSRTKAPIINYVKESNATIHIEVLGSFASENDWDVISSLSISGRVKGKIRYLSDKTFHIQDFDEPFSAEPKESGSGFYRWGASISFTTDYVPDNQDIEVNNTTSSAYLDYKAIKFETEEYLLGVHEINFGMPFIDAYLWENRKSMTSLFDFYPPTIKNAIEDNNFSDVNTISNNVVDKYSRTISKTLLNEMSHLRGIPRFKIDGKTLRLFVPKTNCKTFNNNKQTNGLFIFNEYKNSTTEHDLNTKYWGGFPQVYPDIVFNNMTSTDNYWSVDANNYVLNNHTIKKDSSQLRIDNATYTITPNDSIVCYIRNQGEYVSNCKPTCDDLKIPANEDIKVELKSNLSITSTLTFSDIELYDITNLVFDNSFSASIENKSLFNSAPTSKEIYKTIIYKYPQWEISMPEISGNDYGVKENFFSSLGTYSYSENWWNKNVENITFQKKLVFSNKCTIKNFSTILESPTVTNLWNLNNSSVDCYVYEPGSNISFVTANYINQMRFSVTSTSLVGTFPQNIGFFQGNKEEKNKGSTYVSWKSYLSVDGLVYKYEEYYSSDNAAFDLKFTLTSGYINSPQTDTFALAIVIWRNGKLLS